MIKKLFQLLGILSENKNIDFSKELSSSEPKENNGDYIWCLVGNIVEKHYYGEEKSIKTGTKQFSPNAKVYCFPALWGDGYEDIKVIGHPRKSPKFIVVVMKAKYIKNWRLQKVYHPFIVKTMKENKGWDDTEKSKETILAMLEFLPKRTEEIKE